MSTAMARSISSPARWTSGAPGLLWRRPVEDVVFTDGVFTCTTHPAECISFQELAGQLMRTGGAVTCSASAHSTGVGPIFAGNIVDVEVDPETGKVQILRYTTFLDAGLAVHHSYVEGQMQGGTVQGIGWALNEEYFFTADGTLANRDRKSTRLNSSHLVISYAVFCLKKKNNIQDRSTVVVHHTTTSGR